MKFSRLKYRYLPFYPVIVFIVLVCKNGGFSLRRWPFVLVYFFRFLLLEPLRILELVFFEKRIDNFELEHPPIFILGHWRCGTSYLQNLMCQNPNSTSYTIYRFLLSDIFLLTESLLKRPLNKLIAQMKLPYSFQRVRMDLDIPGEMEVAMCNICSLSSYTWGHIYPAKFNQYTQKWIYNLSPIDAEKWLADYDYLIRKVAFKSKNKQVIVKSPGDTARVKYLLKKYPTAKFIYINRPPINVFFSNRYLWKAIQRENSLQVISQELIDEIIFSNYQAMLQAYNEQKNKIPVQQLYELDYSDLRDNPVRTIQEIYRYFKLKNFPNTELANFIKHSPCYTATTYNPPPEMVSKIKARWSFAFKNPQE